MRHIKNSIIGIALLAGILGMAQEKNDKAFKTIWDNGFQIENEDSSIKLKFGGRIMYDMGFFDLNAEAERNGFLLFTENGNEFRRARLFTSGTIYKNVDYKLQLEFAGGNTVLKDAYITIKSIPIIGNFRAGHFVEPIVLESFTSSKYITFMERSIVTSIVSGRNSGFMVFDEVANNKMSWQIGLYRGAQRETSDSPKANGNYSLTTRVAGTAIKNKETILHLGISHSFRKPQEEKNFEYSIRPDAHLANKYIITNIENVKNINAVNFESSLVVGPFSIQSEYLRLNVKSTSGNETFNALYGQASYFLTGEKRAYKNALNGFGRVKPINNFGDGNIGAIELAIRYSMAEGMNGDEMNNITAGLNWHLNPSTRLMANYVLSMIKNTTQFTGKGNFKAFQMRFQIDF